MYANDELLDSINDIYASEDKPILVGMFGDDEIDVFVKDSKILIRVNGDPWWSMQMPVYFR